MEMALTAQAKGKNSSTRAWRSNPGVAVVAASVALLLFLSAFPLDSRAESSQTEQFVQTDVFTHLLIAPSSGSGDLVTVAVITTSKGIFVAYVPKGNSSYAGFELKDLNPGNSRSLFLAFAGTSQVPERLYLPSGLGGEQSYPIRGTFTVALDTGIASSHAGSADVSARKLGKVLVEVAMNNNSIPYTTISRVDGSKAAIIGLSGTQVVSKGLGGRAVEILGANRSSGPITAEYEINDENRLTLNGRVLSPGSPVGLGTPPTHRCLFEGPSFATEDDVKAFAAVPQPASLKVFVRKRHSTPLALSSFLPLTVSASGILALSYDSGKLGLIQEQRLLSSPNTESVWCVVSSLPVGDASEVSSPAFKDPADEPR